ncbi:DUF4321 domain-containing protein [Ferviditalea candida]|uniref:DUF4321 domain-containing protein n=1 Tax=Ferviditalea candida TaxID=3108399 RepID=A0ABU5ZFB3_9BACL|nr:DUF4321 domain-containing protein [Paenibacillaceae bacterium T2]
MKKSRLLLVILLLIGLLAGSLANHLLSPVKAVVFLTKTTTVAWHPKADLDFLQYDFYIQVKLSLLSLIGVLAAIWLYRRM